MINYFKKVGTKKLKFQFGMTVDWIEASQPIFHPLCPCWVEWTRKGRKAETAKVLADKTAVRVDWDEVGSTGGRPASLTVPLVKGASASPSLSNRMMIGATMYEKKDNNFLKKLSKLTVYQTQDIKDKKGHVLKQKQVEIGYANIDLSKYAVEGGVMAKVSLQLKGCKDRKAKVSVNIFSRAYTPEKEGKKGTNKGSKKGSKGMEFTPSQHVHSVSRSLHSSHSTVLPDVLDMEIRPKSGSHSQKMAEIFDGVEGVPQTEGGSDSDSEGKKEKEKDKTTEFSITLSTKSDEGESASHRKEGEPDHEYFHRIKVMLVGYGGVGKTCLLRSLSTGQTEGQVATEKDMSPQTTDGIDIINWELASEVSEPGKEGEPEDKKKAKTIFSCWDFAGQEDYYAIHHFFLSTNCIYLLVWNPRAAQGAASLLFWLQSIATYVTGGSDGRDINSPLSPTSPSSTSSTSSFSPTQSTRSGSPTKERSSTIGSGSSSTSSSEISWSTVGGGSEEGKQSNSTADQVYVYVVGTHKDTMVQPKIDEGALKKRFPRLKLRFFFVSTKTGDGIPQLRSSLLEIAHSLPIITEHKSTLQDVIIKAEDAVIKLRPSQPLPVDRNDLYKLLNKCGITEEDYDRVAQTLFDRGSLVQFDISALQSLVFYSPEWLVGVLKQVVTARDNGIAHGVLPHSLLKTLWKDQPSHLYPSLLLLMEQFELSFRLDNHSSLVPCLLFTHTPPDMNPYSLIPDKCRRIQHRYKFDFIPSGFFPRFLVRTHQYTSRDKDSSRLHSCWRTGVVLTKFEQTAIVRCKTTTPDFIIDVFGSYPTNLMSILVDTVESMLEESMYRGVKVERCLSCPRCGEDSIDWTGQDEKDREDWNPHLFSQKDCSRMLAKAKQRGRNDPNPLLSCVDCGEGVPVKEILGLFERHALALTSLNSSLSRSVGDFGKMEAKQEEMLSLMTKQLKISEAQSKQLIVLREQQELIQRGLLAQLARIKAQFNLTVNMDEKNTPSIFLVFPVEKKWSEKMLPTKWGKDTFVLKLCCEYPGEIHVLEEEKGYHIDKPAEFLTLTSPILAVVIGAVGSIIGFGVPSPLLMCIWNLGKDPTYDYPGIQDVLKQSKKDGITVDPKYAEGVALRELAAFLHQADPAHRYQGLVKVAMHTGDVCWFCPKHAKQYKASLLEQETAS